MFPRVIRQALQRGNCHSASAIWFLLAPRRPIFLKKSKCCRNVSDKFACLRQHSKPDTQFKFPKTFFGGCNRSFNHDWLDQHKWLCYSAKIGAFCMPCLLFNGMSDSTGKVSGALVTKLFQIWQKKSAKFANHVKTSFIWQSS